MSDLFFLIRAFVFTLIIVFLMQIKIGDQTLEQRSLEWARTSTVANTFIGWAQSNADFVVIMGQKIFKNLNWQSVQELKKENIPGFRQQHFQLERSPEYLEQLKENAAKSSAGTPDAAYQTMPSGTPIKPGYADQP